MKEEECTNSDILVFSSPVEVQSNQPISMRMIFRKYVFLIFCTWRAAASTHSEIWNVDLRLTQMHCDDLNVMKWLPEIML